jgi:hypothetical protein
MPEFIATYPAAPYPSNGTQPTPSGNERGHINGNIQQESPFFRIPPEVLQRIFLSIPLPPLPAALTELTSYLLVCRRWRVTIDQCPQMWSRYNFPPTQFSLDLSGTRVAANPNYIMKVLRGLPAVMRKSHPALLHLSFPSYFLSTSPYRPLGSFFVPLVARWASLHLSLRNPSPEDFRSVLAILTLARVLKELHLTFDGLHVATVTKCWDHAVALPSLRTLKMTGYHFPPKIVAEKLERLELSGYGGKPLQIPVTLLKQIEKQLPTLGTIVFRETSDVYVSHNAQPLHPPPGTTTSFTPDGANGSQKWSVLYYTPSKYPICLPSLTTLIISSPSSPSSPPPSPPPLTMAIYQLIVFGSHKSITTLHISLEVIAGATASAHPMNFETGVKELWIDATASKAGGGKDDYQPPAKWLRAFPLLQRFEFALCEFDADADTAQEGRSETHVALANILLALCGISDPTPTEPLCRSLEGLGCTWVVPPSRDYEGRRKVVEFPYPLAAELEHDLPTSFKHRSKPRTQSTTNGLHPSSSVHRVQITSQQTQEMKSNILLFFLAFSWHRSLFPNGKLRKDKERREWGICNVSLRGWHSQPTKPRSRKTRSKSRATEGGDDEERAVSGLLRDSGSHSEDGEDEGEGGEEGKDLVDVTFAELYEEIEDAGVDVEKVVDLCLGPA